MVGIRRVSKVLFSSDHIIHPRDNRHQGKGSKMWNRVLSGVFLFLSSVFTLGGSAIFYTVMATRKVKQTDSSESSIVGITDDQRKRVLGASIKKRDTCTQYLDGDQKAFVELIKDTAILLENINAFPLSFDVKLALLMKNARKTDDGTFEFTILGATDKSGGTKGEFRLVLREESIIDSGEEVLSQINEPVYRRDLLRHRSEKHYSFEFFDVGRDVEIDQKQKELTEEERLLIEIGEILNKYPRSMKIDAVKNALTVDHRKLLGLGESQILIAADVRSLRQKVRDKIEMFPIRRDSISSEFKKATIKGRFCEDGSIAELKSVNIHSEIMGGKQLMDFWDKFCEFMGAEAVYLEDDAKIEGETGSYSLRFFRLIALEDRTSWYQDSYDYVPYELGDAGEVVDVEDSRESILEAFSALRNISIEKLIAHLDLTDETVAVLEDYNNHTYQEMVFDLGQRVRKGEHLHKELNLVLEGILKTFSEYDGSEPEILPLKEIAEKAFGYRYFRKSYL